MEHGSKMSRKLITSEADQEEIIKKPRLFSAKEFRKQLKQDNSLNALKQFVSALSGNEEHDYILDYLESGGNCLELLQTLEHNSTIPPAMVFELISHVLLKINADYIQYQSSAYEACRYMLNNYIAVINKMINLSSTTPERKACLKLLTAMVTLSPTLAKDVLIHVNFHSTNIELLTKHTGEKDSVRDHFIRFLTAYLIDGQYPPLSALLEKKGFITSIVSGLQFDSADTLCLVIAAMKTYILENPSVSKTSKMKTYNTLVVRDIVKLYNWKGPQAMKSAKNKNAAVTVDNFEKSRVNECVHDFLLVLCTSHKYGVIFKDHLVGLGKKNQNALMYTVLESLDRPWEHSYASELVTKICGACPDLAKTIWGNLKPFLEPRMSEKWLNALKFSKNLIQEFQPNCIDFCMKELSVMQLFQVVTCLVSPLPIIKTVYPENGDFESCSIKQNVLSLLLEMLRSVGRYMDFSKKWLTEENHTKFRSHFANYISRNFPDGIVMLNDWDAMDVSPEFSQLQLAEIIFDVFDCYKNLAPSLLDTLSTEKIEFTELLNKLDKINDETERSSSLRVKIINTFIDLDNSKFSTGSELFSVTIPLLLKYYYANTDSNTLAVLNKLLKNTGVFEGCSYEINTWINAISNLKKFDDYVATSIVTILKITSHNISKYLDELSGIRSENGTVKNISDIIQNLLKDNVTSDVKKVFIRHKYLSPMILGLCEYFSEIEVTKPLKVYSNFVLVNLLHMQTQIEPINQIIGRHDFFSRSLKEYSSCWLTCQEILSLRKLKGKSGTFERFSEDFLFGTIDDFLKEVATNQYSDFLLNLLDACIFYLCNLSSNNALTENIFENCQKFVKYSINKVSVDDIFLERLLGHPVLLHNVSFLSLDDPTSQNYVTSFIVSVFKYLLDVGCALAGYLEVYREKLLSSVLKIMKKPQKYTGKLPGFKELLHLLGLDYHDCYIILSNLSDSFEKYQNCPIICDILVYTLKKVSSSCEKNSDLSPLNESIVKRLTSYFAYLTKYLETEFSSLSLAFLNYFKIFPHDIKNVDEELFESILQLKDYNKDNIAFALFLLERNNDNLKYFISNVDMFCEKKWVLLPFLKVLILKEVDDKVLQNIYEKFEPSLMKALLKPQKAGQHFHQHYEGLNVLIKKFMSVEKCKNFCEKVQKYEISEIFHAQLLRTICVKAMSDSIETKNISNIVLTFVHLQVNLFKKQTKTDEDITKTQNIATIFNEILNTIMPNIADKDMKSISKNETVKMYCKYCLKFGVAGQSSLLKTLSSLIEVLSKSIEIDDIKLIMDMLISHSEFLEAVLGEHSEVKQEILSLFLVLCNHWDELMQRNHIPVLLASYRATIHKCDRIILSLLKMYETKSEQTNFYDFKPFLWGRVAANHYSVRHQIENSLRRQPRMGDVLDILHDDWIRTTITKYPLNEHLNSEDKNYVDMDGNIYDLAFLLPLFSQLLAPEQQVLTYKFTRSGALSLTVISLSSDDEDVRKAACHVLARFYYHVDARQSGKDNLLWIRYVEAVCKGTAILPNFKLNNFAAIYLARMALILTQPNHVMYLPLSQHLTAKSALDFSTVPELYTFLHSSDVNFKEHRHFILELLKDGLRTEKDLLDFVKSMAFKLFSELYSSSSSDSETKLLILDVIRVICGIPLGIKMLCDNHSFLSQVYNSICIIFNNVSKDFHHSFVEKIVNILLCVVKVMQDKHSNFMIFNILKIILCNNSFPTLVEGCERTYFEIIFTIQSRFSDFLSEKYINNLLSNTSDSFSKYLFKYGCDFVNMNEDLEFSNKYFYLRKLIVNFTKKSSIVEVIT